MCETWALMHNTMAGEGWPCRDREQKGSQERVQKWWREVADRVNESKELMPSLWPELIGLNLRDSASRAELLSGWQGCVTW